MLHLQIPTEPTGHIFRKGNHAILFVLALTDVDGFTLKVDVGDLQIDGFLSSQPGRIDQGEDDAVFEQRGCFKELTQLCPVQDGRKARIALDGRQPDGPLVLPDVPEVVTQPINGVFEQTPRRRLRASGQGGKILVDFFLRNVFGQMAEMKTHLGNLPEVVLVRALALPFEDGLLFNFGKHCRKTFNPLQSSLHNSTFAFASHDTEH